VWVCESVWEREREGIETDQLLFCISVWVT
jgi:hypothetical protein